MLRRRVLDLWESVLPFCREHAAALNGPITAHKFGARWSAVGAFMKLRPFALMLAGKRIIKLNFARGLGGHYAGYFDHRPKQERPAIAEGGPCRAFLPFRLHRDLPGSVLPVQVRRCSIEEREAQCSGNESPADRVPRWHRLADPATSSYIRSQVSPGNRRTHRNVRCEEQGHNLADHLRSLLQTPWCGTRVLPASVCRLSMVSNERTVCPDRRARGNRDRQVGFATVMVAETLAAG